MLVTSIVKQYNQSGRDNTVLKNLQSTYLANGKSLFTLNGIDFIYQECPQLLYKIISLTDLKHQLVSKVNSMPTVLHKLTLNKLLEDELVQTNNIENVHTDRNSVRSIINNTAGSNKYKEKQIVEHYLKVIDQQINITTASDISTLYYDFLNNYIDDDDLAHMGTLFRKETVHVLSASCKVIHTGIEGENNITQALEVLLDYLSSSDDNIFIKIASFHYFFAYIHPFYDGNGRMARLLTSSQLFPEISLASLALSNTIAKNQSIYYSMFEETNSSFNVGDVTSFIYQFLDFIEQTIQKTIYHIEKNVQKIVSFKQLLDDKLGTSKQLPYLFIIYQASLVDETLSTSQIADIHSVSIPTALSAMKELAKLDYISIIKIGKSNHALINPQIINILEKE